jgi:hypothetical protein
LDGEGNRRDGITRGVLLRMLQRKITLAYGGSYVLAFGGNIRMTGPERNGVVKRLSFESRSVPEAGDTAWTGRATDATVPRAASCCACFKGKSPLRMGGLRPRLWREHQDDGPERNGVVKRLSFESRSVPEAGDTAWTGRATDATVPRASLAAHASKENHPCVWGVLPPRLWREHQDDGARKERGGEKITLRIAQRPRGGRHCLDGEGNRRDGTTRGVLLRMLQRKITLAYGGSCVLAFGGNIRMTGPKGTGW